MAPDSQAWSVFQLVKAAWKAKTPLKPLVPQNPTRVDEERPSLIQLSDDIILDILQLLYDVSPRGYIELAFVCRHWYQLVRYTQYRNGSLSIPLDDASACDRLNFIMQSAWVTTVCTLRVHAQVPSAGSAEASAQPPNPALSLLVMMIPGMTGLRDIHWVAPTIPENVLDSIRRNPQLRLHVHLCASGGDSEAYAQAQELLEVLVGSPNLFSIRAEVSYFESEEALKITQPLKHLLLTCPNLRRLSLDIAPQLSRTHFTVPSARYCGLGFSQGERPPPMEELEVLDYPWGFDGNIPDSAVETVAVQGFGIGGYPEKGLESEYWVNKFDWSRLRRFCDKSPFLASQLASKLTALQEVEFRSAPHSWTLGAVVAPQSCAAVTARFFESVASSLVSIRIPNLNGLSTAGLVRHGASLRKLSIHTREDSVTSWGPRLNINLDLVTLLGNLPCIEELEVDIARENVDWPWNTLDVLASLPNLSSLKLWFELGLRGSDGSELPYLTANSALALFSYMRERSRSNQYPLSRLHVCSGDPPDLTMRGNTSLLWREERYSPRDNWTSFVCEVDGHEKAKESIRVTCPELSDELNGQMNRIIKGDEERSNPDTESRSFKLALDGPLSSDEWLEKIVQERRQAP